jgi:hypothetical protein
LPGTTFLECTGKLLSRQVQHSRNVHEFSCMARFNISDRYKISINYHVGPGSTFSEMYRNFPLWSGSTFPEMHRNFPV